MDPIGLGFENFDVLGRWRDEDAGLPIDASGELADGEKFRGSAELVAILATRGDDVARNFTDKLLTYALGRGLRPADRCAVDDIVAAARKDDYRFSTIVTAIVTSTPFRMRKDQGAAP